MTTLPCPVAAWARATPDAPALHFNGRLWTYADLDDAVRRTVGALVGCGLGPGDRIAARLGNRPEAVFLLHAAARLGLTVAPLNTRLTPAEVAGQLDRFQPKIVFLDDLTALVSSVAVRPLIDLSDGEPSPLDQTEPDLPWTVLFTSGTTGQPKAAVLTYGAHHSHALRSALNLGGERSQRWLAVLPLFHVGGVAMTVRSAVVGGSMAIHERFDADAVSRALDEDGITHVSLVATALSRLLDHRAGRPLPDSLRIALIGGGPVPPALLARVTGPTAILTTYGLTEAASQVTTTLLGEPPDGTAGVPLSGIEVRVTGKSGAVGEIEVRGPTVMRGYWDDPAATAAAFTPDGWLRTGDLGSLDERGRLTVHSRRSDLIVTGGENVYPAEVEAALLEHSDVIEAAVVGLPDDIWGQTVAAAVVLRRPLSEVNLEPHLRDRLAGYKLPRRFVQLDELPRTASGKVDRPALREALTAAP